MTHFIDSSTPHAGNPGRADISPVPHATTTTRRPASTDSLFAALLVLLASSMHAFAGDNTIECWAATTYDKDGDGYAEYYSHKDDRVELDTIDAFALTWLGHADVRVYDGSWAEWGDAGDVPIETGD